MASRTADAEQAHPRRHREVHTVLAVLIAGIVTCEIVWLAPPVQAAGHALAQPRWAWLAAAIPAEMVSMTAFARLQRTMLKAGGVSVPSTAP
jgi:hypothetical protein